MNRLRRPPPVGGPPSLIHGYASPVPQPRACSHYPQPIGDEREVDKGHEHDIELLEPREDSAETFESTEQPFDLIAPLVHDLVVLPRRDSILFGWYHRDETKVECELPSLVAFVRPVHQ